MKKTLLVFIFLAAGLVVLGEEITLDTLLERITETSYRKEMYELEQKKTEALEKGEYKGWVEFELAWCYALIDEKEKAREYLKEADSYIGGEIVSSFELKKDFETIKKLIANTSYLA